MDRTYHDFDSAKGYPMDKKLFYECLKCGGVVPSWPDDDTYCKCRNIMIDIGAGRIGIQDEALVKLFSEDSL
jgi:hypothetical protein